ncbi:SQUALENE MONOOXYGENASE [Salix purpurea]|uniref:Squalene monooxygenase n=1 Tax=Salix purpurea TaxID=77065 RepID=A0A9Q0V962_SALPP|nr:SQUALENE MONOOXYGENASE [Salix purpurea]
MDSKHIFGGAVAAFLFGFVVLYSSRRREKIKASEKTPTKKYLKSSGNGVCRSNFAGNTDVIIVGAGVAGTTLFYALAKSGVALNWPKLGLEDCLDGSDSRAVFNFAVVHKDGKKRCNFISLQFESAEAFTMAASLKKLRQKAACLPNVNLEQGTVTSLVEENGSIKAVLYKTKGS